MHISCIHKQIYRYLNTHIYMQIWKDIYIYIIYMNISKHKNIYTHKHICTYIYAHTKVYIYIYIYINIYTH